MADLLEAGGPDLKENIHVPAAFGSLFKTDVDWDYATAPEDGCNGRMMYLPRGKTIGGSSSINAMVYIRGAREDYDGWRDAGCAGWGYDDVLPYFMKSEGSTRGSSAVFSLPYLVLSFISGVYFVFRDLPPVLQQVAALFPLKWLCQGLRSVFLPAAAAVAEPARSWETGKVTLVLGAWFVAGLVLCLTTFRWLDRE